MNHSSCIWDVRVPPVINKTLTAARQVLRSSLAVTEPYRTGFCALDANTEVRKPFFPLTQLPPQKRGIKIKGHNCIKGTTFPFQRWHCLLVQWSNTAVSNHIKIPQVWHVSMLIVVATITLTWAYLAFLLQTLSTWKYLTAKVTPNNASATMGQAKKVWRGNELYRACYFHLII